MAQQRIVTEDDLKTLMGCLSYDPEAGTIQWTISKVGVRKGSYVGTLNGCTGYVTVYINGRRWAFSRVAWMLHNKAPIPMGVEIDHIDGNKQNNRISNLRTTTKSENMQNIRKVTSRNVSGLLGVHKCPKSKSDRWVAAMSLNNKYHCIGRFGTPEEAHQAYLEAKRRLHPGCTI